MPVELIVYACPVGALAEQIEAFFAESKRRLGPNAAHGYMPHCTLTGFFRADAADVPALLECLEVALGRSRPARPVAPIVVEGIRFESAFHYLALSSPWARDLAAHFAREAVKRRPAVAIRLKDPNHLSLAYGFPAEQSAPLARLAREMVDPRAPVAWELRFYERHPDGTWTCHWCGLPDRPEVQR